MQENMKKIKEINARRKAEKEQQDKQFEEYVQKNIPASRIEEDEKEE